MVPLRMVLLCFLLSILPRTTNWSWMRSLAWNEPLRWRVKFMWWVWDFWLMFGLLDGLILLIKYQGFSDWKVKISFDDFFYLEYTCLWIGSINSLETFFCSGHPNSLDKSIKLPQFNHWFCLVRVLTKAFSLNSWRALWNLIKFLTTKILNEQN